MDSEKQGPFLDSKPEQPLQIIAPRIGKHKPREVIRVERDYVSASSVQFYSGYPGELHGKLSPVDHGKLLNQLNSILANAYDPYKSIFDNTLSIVTFNASTLLYKSHYQRQMVLFKQTIQDANRDVLNPAGLNLLDPQRVAFLFLELEIY